MLGKGIIVVFLLTDRQEQGRHTQWLVMKLIKELSLGYADNFLQKFSKMKTQI